MSFLIRSKELFQDAVFPITATRLENRPLPQADLHRHEFFEMIFVADGTLHNRLATEETSLNAGDLLIFKPFVQHQLEAWSTQAPPHAYSCSFLPPIIDSNILGIEEIELSKSPNRYFFTSFLALADDETPAVITAFPAKQIEEIESYFVQLVDLAGKDDTGSAAKSKCVFLSLLLKLAEHTVETRVDNRPVQRAIKVAATRHRAGLLKALAYIHNHLSEPITLEEVAEIADVSVSYFSLLIKQYTSMSFINYLTSLRMDLAKSLMRSTSDSMMDICFKVGYSDYSNFSKRFKSVTGYTPRDYRRQGHAP